MKKMRKLFSGLLTVCAALLIPMPVFASEQSLGELLETAAFNTVLGIGTVFIMLIVIALIIYCFRFIPMIQKAFSGKKDTVSAPEEEKTQAAAVSVEKEQDDLELVAVIAAAIAASEQVPLDSFVVRTIKRRG